MRIALIEGLGAYHFTKFLRRAYKDKLEELGHTVVVYPWTVKTIPMFDVIISHSMGAGYAIRNNHKCKLLITMDARVWDFWNNSKLVKPSNAKHHMNIYQTKGFRGYEIDGAFNVLNLESWVTHTNLPKNSLNRVLFILEGLQNE